MEIGTEEASRLATLIEYDILDSEAEEPFDRLAEIAADLFQVPIAAVTLVDGYRQWFKSRVGWTAQQVPRKQAFCEHTIQGGDVFVIPDAVKDKRFAANPLVTKSPSIRFYAGAPLLTGSGHALGTICIMDRRARRTLTAREKRMLSQLAAMVMEQIEIRRHVREARTSLRRISRLIGPRVDAKRLAQLQGDCRKALGALEILQALPTRAKRSRNRLITPKDGRVPRGRRVAVAAERRAERRRRPGSGP